MKYPPQQPHAGQGWSHQAGQGWSQQPGQGWSQQAGQYNSPPGHGQYPPPSHRKGGGVVKKALVAVLALGLLMTAGVVGFAWWHVTHRPKATSGGTPGPWDALADGRTKALAAKDEAAFVRPFIGKATADAHRLYRNLVKLPWASATFVNEYSAPLNGRIRVEFVHQIQGVDLAPVYESYDWEVQPGQGSPNITGIGPAQDLVGSSKDAFYPGPWDVYDDMKVLRAGSVVVIAPPSAAAAVDRDAPAIAKAAITDLTFWRQNGPGTAGTPQGFMVILEPDRTRYSQLFRSGAKNDPLEAGVTLTLPKYDPRAAADSKTSPAGSRIVMDLTGGYFDASRFPGGVTAISRHEMAHAIVRPLQGAKSWWADVKVPTWVVEGFAEWMEQRDNLALMQRSWHADLDRYPFNGRLPSDEDFYSGNARDRGAHYTLGETAIQFMAERFGVRKTLAFVAAQYRDSASIDPELKDATGLDYGHFEAAWSSWLRGRLPTLGHA